LEKRSHSGAGADPTMDGRSPARSVLLIDADMDTREILSVMLGEAGWDVVETDEIGKGVELARRLRPAAVISEYTLAPVSAPGRSVPDELGRAGVTPRVHIVFTADVRTGVAERVESAGCVHIRKPASPSRVLEELERRLAIEPGDGGDGAGGGVDEGHR
ncbi:MAG: hypothetical protein ACN0LA_04775, partial [Candidatus Longimicrobiales bacterium M2_2A_002]